MLFLKFLQAQFRFFIINSLEGGPQGEDIQPTVFTTSEGKRLKDGFDGTWNEQSETPEQEKVRTEIAELQKELEGIDAAKAYTGRAGEYLTKKLSPEDYNDPEAKETIRLLEAYKRRYLEALKIEGEVKQQLQELKQDVSKLGDSFEYKTGFDADNAGDAEQIQVTPEKLKNISNSEFLELPDSQRLQYVTTDNVDGENISNGNVKTLEFTFDMDGDGQDNRDLFLKTTAGQVLPDEVASVTSNGESYSRANEKGEFFNENNQRLIIRTGTQIEITDLRDSTQMEALNTTLTSQLAEYKGTPNEAIASQALSRGIDAEFAIAAFSKLLTSSNPETTLEDAFTEFDRQRGSNNLESDSQELSLIILKKFAPDTMKDSAKDLGISEETIANFESNFEGEKHKQYSEVIANLGEKYSIDAESIIRLIYHENRNWDPTIKNPNSSAYGLGQMIDKTWAVYGAGLDRNNPEHQLEATVKYLHFIKEKNNCTTEEALAYYNTGENFNKDSLSLVKSDYMRYNTPIVNKIPHGLQSDGISNKDYFIGAVAYYNDLSFEEANQRIA